MSTRERMKSGQQTATRAGEAEPGVDTEPNGPRKMTVAENVILTVKVLAGFGLLGAALWGINLWTSGK